MPKKEIYCEGPVRSEGRGRLVVTLLEKTLQKTPTVKELGTANNPINTLSTNCGGCVRNTDSRVSV